MQLTKQHKPKEKAGVAQMEEPLICNQQVEGSIPSASASESETTKPVYLHEFRDENTGCMVWINAAHVVRIDFLSDKERGIGYGCHVTLAAGQSLAINLSPTCVALTLMGEAG